MESKTYNVIFLTILWKRNVWKRKRDRERYKCLLVCRSVLRMPPARYWSLDSFWVTVLCYGRQDCIASLLITFFIQNQKATILPHGQRTGFCCCCFKKMHSPYLTLGSCIFSGYLFASWKQRKCFQHTIASDFEIHPISIIAIN